MKYLILLLSLQLHLSTAFVVPAVERGATAEISGLATTTFDPAWRVALNFGKSTINPFGDFGASGARLPVVIPCEFTDSGLAMPRYDTVSYTDITGGIVKPVQGGSWKISNNGKKSDAMSQNLQMTLTFPEELRKGDVIIPAQSTVSLEGLVYSQEVLKKLDEAFSNARSDEWKAEETLEEVYKERDGPKKWNPKTQAWERPTMDVPLTDLFQKHWTVFSKKQETRRRNAARPRSSDLSKQSGPFPGYEDRVYFGQQGIIRIDNNVVGTWSAEPMNDVPATYFGTR
ncbi:expressed unknown protein [Seminavis robusta]|uniref:Uncharacterized protein n=1 Tax=Seminavis robusta TaxID=568900 RepID=A0A9N8HNJ7_9STRA|nr:expressed unknown protein [Seminavis robusta]|eukprot:Sro1090_g240200.1 n/a (286) ;mRNA; f:31633-32490